MPSLWHLVIFIFPESIMKYAALTNIFTIRKTKLETQQNSFLKSFKLLFDHSKTISLIVFLPFSLHNSLWYNPAQLRTHHAFSPLGYSDFDTHCCPDSSENFFLLMIRLLLPDAHRLFSILRRLKKCKGKRTQSITSKFSATLSSLTRSASAVIV